MRFDTRSARKAAALATAIRVGEACDACGRPLSSGEGQSLCRGRRPTGRKLCRRCAADTARHRIITPEVPDDHEAALAD